MAQMTFLNLLSHAKVCSHDMVFVVLEMVLTTTGNISDDSVTASSVGGQLF